MTYSSENIVVGDDVVDRFWDGYFGGQVPVGSAYVSGNRYYGGTTNFTAANTIGYSSVYWFQNDSNFPGSQSHPGSATAPSRSLNDITGDISASGIFSAIKNEVQRFTNYNGNVKWYVTRNWLTYTVSGAGYQGPEGWRYKGQIADITLYQRAHEQVKPRWMTTPQFTFTDPANNITAGVDGDDVSTGEFDTLFQAFANAYNAKKSSAITTTVVQSYTQCHNSCHTSCHGSRGRR
jgi:hypothetical protein